MKNPCDNCLLKPCCSCMCNNKDEYTEFLINALTDISHLMYDEKGNKVNTGILVKLEHERILKLAQQNADEKDKIFDRYFSIGINRS